MGMDLPNELTEVLSVLGYTWPQADEEKMFEMGQAWIDFSGKINDFVGVAHDNAAQAVAGYDGKAKEAFEAWWAGDESPTENLQDGANGAVLTGTGLIICAGIVLALKIAVIIQLIVLAVEIAQAIATAVVTFGASLAEIPIFQQISRTIVGNLVQEVLWKLVDG